MTATDFPHPSRVTSSGSDHVTGLLAKCPADCVLAENHEGDHLPPKALPKVGDRAQVYSSLNEGRYNGRWATVLNTPTDRNPKFRVMLDSWTRGLEPHDGCLYLYPTELLVPEQ